MSIRRKTRRSKNFTEYIHETDDNGNDVLYVKKGGIIVDVVELHEVGKNADGEDFITLERDGVEQSVLVKDYIAEAGGLVKNITLPADNS